MNELLVSCVIAADELAGSRPDLILFPEGVSPNEIELAWNEHPRAVIVGSILENGYGRAIVLHEGQNRIDYLKIGDDGRTIGSNNHHQDSVYEYNDVCLGVLICMDVNAFGFSRPVIERVRTSRAGFRFICIPADMASHWFNGESVSREYDGVHVALCNHTKTYQHRCKSFVTDRECRKVVLQTNIEPVSLGVSSDAK